MDSDHPMPEPDPDRRSSEPVPPDLFMPDPFADSAPGGDPDPDPFADPAPGGDPPPDPRRSPLFVAVDTVIVRVRDLAASRAWYEERLGLEVSFEGPGIVVLDLGEGRQTSITLYELSPGEAETAPGRCFPVLRVDDAAAVRDTLEGRGVEVEPIKTDGTTRWFGFSDLEGCRIEVCQIVAPGWA